jgi:hypothetical protein
MQMDRGKPDDSQADNKTLAPRQRREMINDLENLSGMLDDEPESSPAFDDLPVLKSFVDPATLGRHKNSPARAAASMPVPQEASTQDTRKRFDPSLGGTPIAGTPQQQQQLRQRTSEIVDDLVASALPRLEAELRARLEHEIGQMLRDR